ncbi:hypothetical protein ACP3VS_18820 [Lysinibacillus sp. VIII_CA]|uniref:hypothetical protein n=1 Tax=Lysinibacillus sp. VIII_CA TaxID=3417452 RepID=UPI003CEF353B
MINLDFTMIIVGIVGIILGIFNFLTVSDPLSPQPFVHLQMIFVCVVTYCIMDRNLTGIVGIVSNILKGICVIGILFSVLIIITDYRAARKENEI